jgi:tRNA modification GTPase
VNVEDTIAAIASAPGGAFRGIVRISGPDVQSCLRTCFRGTADDEGRRAQRRVIPGELELPPPIGKIPCDLYLWPGVRSYTRQPVAELHTIGSPPLLDAVLRAVCAGGARLAEPGEFTFRAFLAGRLDLTQAEAVLGLIDARNRQQFDAALSQLAGGVHETLQSVRNGLLDLLAHLEAGLDFVEEDIEFISSAELDARLNDAISSVADLADQMRGRGTSGDEFRVVLIGWPNVGKSSLLNALVGQSAAIVSGVAGTTRDYVTRRATILGLNCLLIDTPGTEMETDPGGISQIAQRLAAQQAEQADVQVLCLDASRRMNAWEREVLGDRQPAHRLVVLTKTDEPQATDWHRNALATSSRSGAGIDELRRAIANCILNDQAGERVVAGTAIRCRESLRLSAEALRHAQRAVRDEMGEEIVAAETRLALDELAKVVGAVYTDDILDRIFSRFCIGK